MLCFKCFSIRRIILKKIGRSFQSVPPEYKKNISVYIFVDSRKIKVHWTRFHGDGVVTIDIKMHINATRKVMRGNSISSFEH